MFFTRPLGKGLEARSKIEKGEEATFSFPAGKEQKLSIFEGAASGGGRASKTATQAPKKSEGRGGRGGRGGSRGGRGGAAGGSGCFECGQDGHRSVGDEQQACASHCVLHLSLRSWSDRVLCWLLLCVSVCLAAPSSAPTRSLALADAVDVEVPAEDAVELRRPSKRPIALALSQRTVPRAPTHERAAAVEVTGVDLRALAASSPSPSPAASLFPRSFDVAPRHVVRSSPNVVVCCSCSRRAHMKHTISI